MSRFLALGDSYTIGEGVAPRESWPARLHEALEVRGSKLEASQVIAATGWTAEELMAGIEAECPTGPCALVTLLIGVNDQYRDLPVARYRTGLVALLARAIELADGATESVLVISIPDWGLHPSPRAGTGPPSPPGSRPSTRSPRTRRSVPARGGSTSEPSRMRRWLPAPMTIASWATTFTRPPRRTRHGRRQFCPSRSRHLGGCDIFRLSTVSSACPSGWTRPS